MFNLHNVSLSILRILNSAQKRNFCTVTPIFPGLFPILVQNHMEPHNIYPVNIYLADIYPVDIYLAVTR